MANAGNIRNNNEEPSTAPDNDRWYNLTLGSSFKNHSSTKFCTLRYEFKPASIDKNQPGSLHKNKENRVSVEFHNNQHGKPKVTFEGSSEDYKENDAVLFFDGETFRLERLHRAVKRLRHVRLPGESTAIASTAAATSVGLPAESCSSPIGKGAKVHSSNKSTFHPPPGSKLCCNLPLIDLPLSNAHRHDWSRDFLIFLRPMKRKMTKRRASMNLEDRHFQLEGKLLNSSSFEEQGKKIHTNKVEVERIDIGDSESLGAKPKNERTVDYPSGRPNPPAASPDAKNFDLEEPLEIVNDDEDVCRTSDKGVSAEKEFHTGIDINLPHQNDTDDEIAEVDVSDDELDKGRNAAEALRAQVSAEGKEEHTSSSGGSSGSESSGSGSGSGSGSDSGSSSSDSESSDSDSVNSI